MAAVIGLLAGLSAASMVLAVAVRIEPRVVGLFHPSRATGRGAVLRMASGILTSRLVRRLVRVDRLAAAIAASGRAIRVDDVVAAKVVAALVVTSAFLAIQPGLAPLGVVAGAGAFVGPDIVLSRAAGRRRRSADAEVPQFLDLLAASSSAGMSAPASILRAASGVRGRLGDELGAAAAAVQMGGRWRDELGRIADRLALVDLRSAVVVLTRTETLGSSLSESLRELAAEVRESRRVRATERARTAPVKMLFPLVFMVLPAFLLLTVVPVLVATIRSLS